MYNDHPATLTDHELTIQLFQMNKAVCDATYVIPGIPNTISSLQIVTAKIKRKNLLTSKFDVFSHRLCDVQVP